MKLLYFTYILSGAKIISVIKENSGFIWEETMEDNTILSYGKTPVHTVLKLSWPAVAEQLLICLVSLVDMAMVGSIGAFATAAIALTASSTWFVNGFNTAVCTAFMFIVARYIGEKKPKMVESAVRQAVAFSFLMGGIITIIAILISSGLPVWLGGTEEILKPAEDYFRILGFTFWSVTVSTVVSGVMRAAGNTKLPLFANIAANLFNVVGNFLLIYPTRSMMFLGHSFTVYGAGMGVAGAALSTSVSRFALALFLVVMLYGQKTPVQISIKGDYRFTRSIFRDVFKIGVPVGIERCMLCTGQIILTTMVSRLGTAALAAHYLTDQIEGIFYLPSYGLADSATALIGQSLGAKKNELADRFARIVCVVNIIAVAAMCVPVFIFSRFAVSLFSNDANVIKDGIVTLRLAAGFEIFFSLYIVISGICRGAGDVKIPLIASFVGMWAIRLGSCYVLAYTFNMGVAGIWLGIGFDTLFRGILCIARIKSGKWKYAYKR